MTQTQHLPSIGETAQFFSSLFGAGATIEADREFNRDSLHVFASYTDDNDATQHFVACDLSAAAVMGAALTAFPPAFVREAEGSGSLPENLLLNLQEVLNISANLFPQSRDHRIVLDEVSIAGEARDRYNSKGEIPETHWKVTVPRYGEGTLVIGAT